MSEGVKPTRRPSKRIVVVGGVAGGASAAARARRLDEQASIIVLERGKDASFANCGLPYYVGGEIDNRDRLLVAGETQLKGWLNLDVRTESEVTAIDRQAKTVTVKHLASGRIYTQPYDYLILSTGAAPIRPGALLEKVGPHHPRVVSLRNLEDVDRIKSVVDQGILSAVVIGGGFIGLEVAEQLAHRKIQTSVVELLPQVMPPMDAEMVSPIHDTLARHGVDLHLDDGVAGIEPLDDRVRVQLNSGAQLAADLVVLAIGVRPETELAREAGLELNERGAIRVDVSHQTDDLSIYAVGDAVEVTEPIFGGKTFVPLGGPANRQGRLVADHMASREGAAEFSGPPPVYRGSQGTSIVRVFDVVAGMTGMSEKALSRLGKQRGADFDAVYAHPSNHASYYPGATQISIKLLYEKPSGRVLGAQAIGADGVDKRIDVIAMAIQMGATVFDLEQAELCYAPPFGSAKDPVNFVGFLGANALRGLTKLVYADELAGMMEEAEVTVLDVRADPEYATGAIPTAIHVPMSKLRERLDEIPRDKPVVPYCKVGLRGYLAERVLRQNQFPDVRNLNGGYDTWKHFYPEPPTVGDAPAGNESPSAISTSSPKTEKTMNRGETETLDARGLQCPGPLMALADRMATLSDGNCLRVLVSDPGFPKDVAAWCLSQGHTLLESGAEDGDYVALIQSGRHDAAPSGSSAVCGTGQPTSGKGQTIVVFSGDLDRVLAAFVIANGAAAMGHPVTMFFTFWGLNALRRENPPKVSKGVLDGMFGWMMPRGPERLSLSKMNMAGMGTAMMKHVMKTKGVASLPKLMEDARRQGIKLVACTMSMDVMGIQREELIDGLELAGVGAYIGDAQSARMNLFI